MVVNTMNSIGVTQLSIRSLDQLQASPLDGTTGASQPFFSPDGQRIGFFAEGKLKKISSLGGPVVTVCDARLPRGGSWGEDGTIVFNGIGAGLSKVSSAGGTPVPLTTPDPAFAPDGKRLANNSAQGQ
jgi:eukaryotic-like serine/threonine-protein kinase